MKRLIIAMMVMLFAMGMPAVVMAMDHGDMKHDDKEMHKDHDMKMDHGKEMSHDPRYSRSLGPRIPNDKQINVHK